MKAFGRDQPTGGRQAAQGAMRDREPNHLRALKPRLAGHPAVFECAVMLVGMRGQRRVRRPGQEVLHVLDE